MTTALFIVSEHGYWGEECIEPLTTLDSEGFDITVATPSGDPPVLDERSVDPEEVGEETAERVREIHETDDRLNAPRPTSRVEAVDYDAVVFPGGHGTVWDVNQDRDARRVLRNALSGDSEKALVVCHAVGILAWVREARAHDEDAGFVVDGREVTGFPNAWEADIVDDDGRMPDGRKLPYWVEEEVVAAGGDWDAELDSDTSVTVDGDLVTARGPESSAAAAQTLLDELAA